MDEGLSPRAHEPRRPLEVGEGATSGASPEPGGEALMMQILSTEHFSLLTSRSLVYNEAFTRVGMFLTFLSMSFVALALLSGAMPIGTEFLVIAAIVLGFDLVIGLTTFVRVGRANTEDLLTVQAMNRIRHGYLRLSPDSAAYFSTGMHDDLPSVMRAYGTSRSTSLLSNLSYGLSTSLGMAGIVVSLVAGAFAAIVALALGAAGVAALAIGAVAAVVVFAGTVRWAYRGALRTMRELEVRFPAVPRSIPRQG